MNHRMISQCIGLGLLFTSSRVFAEAKPNGLFCDNAVLQQGKEVPVWGTAREGEVVTVEIENQKVSTTAKDGNWMVRLKSLQVGGPYVMKISGDNTVTLRNLLVGEVWLCSGQSNMDRSLAESTGGAPVPNREAEATAARYPQMRFFTVKKNQSDTPQTQFSGNWQLCTPKTVLSLSAVGYFFGSELHKSIKVPAGLIVSSWGGTPAEAWMPREVFKKDGRQIMATQNQAAASSFHKTSADPEEHPLEYERAEPNPENDKHPARKGGGTITQARNSSKNFKRPSCLYKAMIHPLLPYAIRGAIWYQGEANRRNTKEYQTLFPAMIASWRKSWNQGDLPFLFVQLAPDDSMPPEIREAQLLTWKSTPHTAMVVTTDVGDAKNVHLGNKRPVGDRLALAARTIAYGEELEFSGPTYESMTVQGAQAVLTFNHCGLGLLAKEGELKGFVIAGDDLQFVPAEAKIKGKTVVVSSAFVPSPKAVRAGWANVPDVNLYNQEGLPASPFRTDVP